MEFRKPPSAKIGIWEWPAHWYKPAPTARNWIGALVIWTAAPTATAAAAAAATTATTATEYGVWWFVIRVHSKSNPTTVSFFRLVLFSSDSFSLFQVCIWFIH